MFSTLSYMEKGILDHIPVLTAVRYVQANGTKGFITCYTKRLS